MSIAENKQQLRRQLRRARRSLSAEQQQQAAFNLLAVIKPMLRKQRVKRIGIYLAMDGEIDLSPLISYCEQRQIELYLPVINRFRQTLWFARYQAGQPLYLNQYSIPEPLKADAIRPWQLNWVFLPLVGFDAHGGRLGMGGGFYDRTFANAHRWPKRPRLFGVAHECQRQDSIPLEPWDIRLDGVLSDQYAYPAI